MEKFKFWLFSLYTQFSFEQLALFITAMFVFLIVGKISATVVAIFSMASGVVMIKLLIEWALRKYTDILK